MSFSVDDIVKLAGEPVRTEGNTTARFTSARPLNSANTTSLVWVKPGKRGTLEALLASPPAVVICAEDQQVPAPLLLTTAFAHTRNPKLVFTRVLRALFAAPSMAPGLDPTALVAAGAQVDPTAWVGPYSVLRRVVIGARCRLDGYCYAYDQVTLHEGVQVAAHAVLGVDGFGYAQAQDGQWEQMPHLGGVVLERDVTVGAHTCVVRGTLGDTVVGRGTKLDNYVTIGHNAQVGAHVLIGSHAIVCGSAEIGEGAWVSPQAVILNGVKVGAGATIGAAALVVADVPAGAKVVARPARVLTGALARLTRPLA